MAPGNVSDAPLLDPPEQQLQTIAVDANGHQAGETNGSDVERPAAVRAPAAPPAVTAEQLEGEQLRNDPDWPNGVCWLTSYAKMHEALIQKAKAINAEGRSSRAAAEGARGEAVPTVADSMRMLRRQVFVLCPMRFLIGGVFVSFGLTILSFMAPYVSGKIVDSAVGALWKKQHSIPVDIWGDLIPNLMLYTILLFSSYICEVLVGILFAISGHTTVTRLRIKLFRNLICQEIAFYDDHVSGELSSRLINDSGALSGLVQFTTQTFLGANVKFIGSLIAMYSTHWQLAVIATIITPVNLLLVRRTGRTVGYYGVVQNQGMAKANAVAVEVLGSIRAVQTNVGEQMEAHRFMMRLNYFLRVIKATVYAETILRFTSYGLGKARDVVVLAYAMHQVAAGELTIGSYTAFAQYISLYENGFNDLANIWMNFKQTITSTGKFVQLLLREPRISLDGGLEPVKCLGALTFDNVRFSYKARPDNEVLKGVSIKAVPGDVIALVGESGAGKTTVGRLIQRYYDPSHGRVLLDGLDFRELSVRWLRAQIGVVEQEPVLFDRPLVENIAYGSAQGKSIENVRAAARLANADKFISELEGGYNAYPGERASRISGGQKQRVAIARAVVRDPKVLLLDEATSALDSENEHIVQEALDRLMQGKTTFIIAHRLSTVVRASNILVLQKGVVLEQGTHEELVNREGSKYASFMQHQLISQSPLLQ